MDLTKYNQIAEKWNGLKTDQERLKWLTENKGQLIVMLDNDQSSVEFDVDEVFEEDVHDDIIDKIHSIMLNDFDKYHYWSGGVFELFEFIGIKAQGV